MINIGVLTSGGDAPGMNAAIRAVVRTALHEGMKVFGIRRGYEGLIDGDIFEMTVNSVGDRLHRGGTMLETARSERFRTEEGRKKAYNMLQAFGISALVVIGGDGSMRGAQELSAYGVPIMCLPGTIDNDLAYTDFTIGFDTAVNTVVNCISNIRDTSSSHDRTTVVEVMGRHCGDIALHAGLASGAESILIPEASYDINAICRKIIQGHNRGKKHNIIMKAEGVDIDSFELAKKLDEMTGVESKVVVLSYLQRGGSPTAKDRNLASRLGAKAVELIKEGSESRAIGVQGGQVVHYTIDDALAMKSEFDSSYLELAEILS